MNHQNDFYVALTKRMGAEIIGGSESFTEKQLRFMIRVAPGPCTTIWLGIIKHLLISSSGADWTLDISKQYFTTPDGDLKYGWRVIIQSTKVQTDLIILGRLVMEAQVKTSQIEEVKLYGSPNRKHGDFMGHVAVGALAVRG